LAITLLKTFTFVSVAAGGSQREGMEPSQSIHRPTQFHVENLGSSLTLKLQLLECWGEIDLDLND